MKNLFYLLTAASLLFLTGCLSTDVPNHYKTVEGVVLHDGEPLSNAGIHIRSHFNPGGFTEWEKDPVTLEFETPVPQYFYGELSRYEASEPFATFFEDSLSPGEHKLTIPDSLLSNGVFVYTLRTDLNQGFSGLLVINQADSLLPGTVPFTRTSEEGEFAFSPIFLGFGDSFESEERGNFEITDSLEFIITSGDSIFTTQKVHIKPKKQNFFEITGN